MNLKLESLHALAKPIVESTMENAEESVFADTDFCGEICNMVMAAEEVTDLQIAVERLTNVCNIIKDRGCSRELIVLCGEELAHIGIELSESSKDEAVASLEALISKDMLDSIKKTLMKIIDSIVRIVEKVADHNKRDSNLLTSLIEGRLSNIEKVDKEKFTNVVVTAYPKQTFMKLVNEFSSIDLDREVGDEKSLRDALSPSLVSLLKEAGWEVGDSAITRTDDPAIKRDKIKNLGWDPSHLRDAAVNSKATLDHLRTHDLRVVNKQRNEVKSLKGDTAAVDKARNKLTNIMKTIVVVDRLSLILSRQIIAIVGTLKDKRG